MGDWCIAALTTGMGHIACFHEAVAAGVGAGAGAGAGGPTWKATWAGGRTGWHHEPARGRAARTSPSRGRHVDPLPGQVPGAAVAAAVAAVTAAVVVAAIVVAAAAAAAVAAAAGMAAAAAPAAVGFGLRYHPSTR